MEEIIYILRQLIVVGIDVLLLAMFVRAIFSWFDPMQENRFHNFLMVLTEPVIYPIRALCAKRHWFESLPMDIPYLITILLLSLFQTLVMIL